MVPNWEDFYAKNPPPADLAATENLLKEFVERHAKDNKRVVLVTSGGTTIPLEHNTVRYVDNFSAGTRGSISTEYFLEYGFAVIFMHRTKTFEPFSRHFANQRFLDMLKLTEIDGKKTVAVSPESAEKVTEVLTKYKKYTNEGNFLQIDFTTLSEYLWLLRSTCQALVQLADAATLYLAAAVSDFYIPSNEMSVHKIPSNTPQTLSLQLVPKILVPLVSLWVPKAFVISFKLETDENVLIPKARDALNKYKHTLVIANMLQTRKQQVIMVTNNNHYTISLTDEQLNNGEEIEKYIVADIVEKQKQFVVKSATASS